MQDNNIKRSPDCGSSSGLKNKREYGRKKKCVADDEYEKKRFQQTFRCSLGEVNIVANLLKKEHARLLKLVLDVFLIGFLRAISLIF